MLPFEEPALKMVNRLETDISTAFANRQDQTEHDDGDQRIKMFVRIGGIAAFTKVAARVFNYIIDRICRLPQ